MRTTQFLLAVLVTSAMMAGCMNVGSNSGQIRGEVHFLRQRDTDAPQMLALLEGKLILTEGCLRIQDGYGQESHATIWPFEFNFVQQDSSFDILNGEGQVVAQVGDQLRVSGGEIPPLSEEAFAENFIGDFQCSGRYWIVNNDVEVVTP